MTHDADHSKFDHSGPDPRPPELRAPRGDEYDRAIRDPAGLGAVLACGRCDRAIEVWDECGDRLCARPCGCEVVDAPAWARNAKKRRAGR